jgi:prevent-host-death family protein
VPPRNALLLLRQRADFYYHRAVVWTEGAGMIEIGAFEARNRLGTLLDRVEQGEEVSITRRGKVVARLVPVAKPFDTSKAAQAVANIVARRTGIKLTGLKIKKLVDEGRR